MGEVKAKIPVAEREANRKKGWLKKTLKRGLFILLGTLFVSVALENFLVPNQVIDGGVVGISIMLSYITQLPLGLFLFVLNIPFLFFGYKQIGKTFTLSTLFAVTCLSVAVNFFHGTYVVTTDPLLAAVFGGVLLGIGVGLVIRYNGSLDGTEIVAIALTRKTSFSVGEIVMFFNLFILGSAAFLFGPDNAMYSLLTYFVTFKVIDMVIEGLEESKSVTIISENAEEIGEAIMDRLGRGITYVEGRGGYTGDPKTMIYCVVTRLELAKLRSTVLEIDSDAFMAIEHVSEVAGGRFKKKAIHP